MDPRKVALWRYEQIEPLLDPTLSKLQRLDLLQKTAELDVRWPSGAHEPISQATLYRWIRAYQSQGLQGLKPAVRKPTTKRCSPLDRDTLEYVLALLREEPARSLTILLKLLEVEKGRHVARSTLGRHLKRHSAYRRIRQSLKPGGSKQLRRRFQAANPHQIWQCDAKGPFRVRLQDGKSISVHVLTIIDDFSRATLAWVVSEHADMKAAIVVFVSAARRWGLPQCLYVDRASIFDARDYRSAVASLGVFRIRSRPRNPPARGKIEAYHRILESWFIRELRHQSVVDLEHLNQLLTGVLESLYMEHRHRGLKQSPRAALGERHSSREISADRLTDAFLSRKVKRAHPKTGEVELGGILFKVPSALRGEKLPFAWSIAEPSVAYVELGGQRKRLALAVNIITPDNTERHAPGRLQAICDHWRGRKLPQAQAGFGLPEIFTLLTELVGRKVPRDELEAEAIQEFYHRRGPLPQEPLRRALGKIFRALGTKRSMAAYLEALAEAIQPPNPPKKGDPQ